MSYECAEIGERIKCMRKERGLTQTELAEKLQISLDYLQKIERSQRNCPLDILVSAASLFDVSIDYIVTGENFDREEQKRRIVSIVNELNDIANKI